MRLPSWSWQNMVEQAACQDALAHRRDLLQNNKMEAVKKEDA